jgi:hypothetical protein
MTVRMLDEGGRNKPILMCDVCGMRIVNGGAVCFDMNEQMAAAVHVHKGDCLNTAETQIDLAGGSFGWSEMRDHLYYLCANVGLTPEAHATTKTRDDEGLLS